MVRDDRKMTVFKIIGKLHCFSLCIYLTTISAQTTAVSFQKTVNTATRAVLPGCISSNVSGRMFVFLLFFGFPKLSSSKTVLTAAYLASNI